MLARALSLKGEMGNPPVYDEAMIPWGRNGPIALTWVENAFT